MLKYLNYQNGSELEEIDGLAPFKCIILICENVSADWQDAVSKWLVDSGCLFMMAWGIDCGSWDDSVNSFMDKDEIPNDQFVITTWHSDESLGDVFNFANYAIHPDVEIKNLLILDIRESERQTAIEAIYKHVRWGK